MISPQPFNRSLIVVPSDTVAQQLVEGAPMQALYVGVGGNVVLAYKDGTTITLTGVLAGTVYNVTCLRVNSTSTTATNMVAFYRV